MSAQDTASVYHSPLREQPLSGPVLADLMGEVLARGMAFRFCAGGSSMFPFIRDGDVISIIPLAKKGPKMGDVVAFRQAGSEQLIVHRLVRRSGNCFYFRGDNYPRGLVDGPIPKENMLGSISTVERVGRPITFGLGPERFLIAVVSLLGWLQPSVWFTAKIYRWVKNR